MAKKSRNQKTKYKKRNPAAALLDGLLTLLDRVLEGFAAAVVAVLRGIGWLMAGLLRGLLWLVKRLLLLLAWPLGRLWRLMTGRRNRAQRCLRLTGFEFEEYMAQVLRDNAFRHVEVTVECGDQGVDILAVRGGKTYAIQCKNYAGAVGNAAVQEAYRQIQSLSPYPCAEFSRAQDDGYVVPDVLLQEKDGVLSVAVNRAYTPELSVSSLLITPYLLILGESI